MKEFNSFLQKLGYTQDELSQLEGNIFTYSSLKEQSLAIHYNYTPTTQDIFKVHREYWNENKLNIFIAVGKEKTYLINSKSKPINKFPLPTNILIKIFDYGVNSEGSNKEEIHEISKDYIDSGYFFDFVIKHKKKNQEVDKDLLLNLIALRNNLSNGNNDGTIHLLILRCLFIKYLEDRGIYDNDYLLEVLQSQKSKRLIHAFEEIRKINGDIFKYDIFNEKDLQQEYLIELTKFFSSDYRSGQYTLFPYRFDKIPIQLISHVYEAFLSSEEKKGKGIYYTPSFLVDFILSQTLDNKISEKDNITVLDPAVGSGAFLVESFKRILKHGEPELISYSKKKEILQNQLFGIDNDPKALQIAAFSLYLALLETEKPEFIREQIENSHPILPSLIGTSLIQANTLTDDVFKNKKFDCIVSNPPWGSVEPNGDDKNKKEREAIGIKGKKGTIHEYLNVSDYERSQAFLIRVKKWSKEDTVLSLIVKNSIFLNDNSKDFRKEILKTYQINCFYELSNYNKVLFKKHIIGKIGNKNIEIGATEPCVILVFELLKEDGDKVKYISPKLTSFFEYFQLIHYTQKDKTEIEQNRFLEPEGDLLWRILVNGDLEDYKLIDEKLIPIKRVRTICKSGFKASRIMVPLGNPDFKKWLKKEFFERYRIIKQEAFDNSFFNINRAMERPRKDRSIFNGNRILIKSIPTLEHQYKLTGIILKEECVHTVDISSLKLFDENSIPIVNIKPYLGILNSSIIGYFINQIAPRGQNKGQAYFRNLDIEKITFPILEKEQSKKMEELVNMVIENKKKNIDTQHIENQIDEIVFDLFDLTEYEKEIIREFFQIRVERADSGKQFAKSEDMRKYIEKFSVVFNDMLIENRCLKATFRISANIGAAVCFTIIEGNTSPTPEEDNKLEILNFVKRKQLKQADISNLLKEDKVKIYDSKDMYIIKSNLFKDWTIRQAMKDAKEEIGLLLSELPDTHE